LSAANEKFGAMQMTIVVRTSNAIFFIFNPQVKHQEI
jgi:hypothetical protein